MADRITISFGPNIGLLTLFNEFDKYRKIAKLTDFTLFSDTESFPVHKLILSTQSKYFASRLEGRMSQENFSKVDGLDEITLQNFINIMYCQSVSYPVEQFDSLIRLVQALDFFGAFPQAQITIENGPTKVNIKELYPYFGSDTIKFLYGLFQVAFQNESLEKKRTMEFIFDLVFVISG